MSNRPRVKSRRAPSGGVIVFSCLALCGAIAPSACTVRTEESLGFQAPAPSSFVEPEASTPPEEAGLTQYCPSDQCPKGHTTCPLSNFRCDVNLLTDRNNCGACGVVCPVSAKGATFECVDGACAMSCTPESMAEDCDGIVDNGCETPIVDNDNCKTCGNKCPADKACVDRGLYDIGCGCKAGDTYCPESYPVCIDTSFDDANCGGCGNLCDPNQGGGPPPYANTYYGCAESKCGAVKCTQYHGDCDGDVELNGCETEVVTNDNCGACGIKCQPGEECRFMVLFGAPPMLACMCPAGQTFCPFGELDGIPAGKCYDLKSDNTSCGACGNVCSWDGSRKCVYGVCRLNCFEGTADCNGSEGDGCEVNTNSDPNNCGACGNRCDAVAGQACVGGRCVVEPCDEVDAGGPTR